MRKAARSAEGNVELAVGEHWPLQVDAHAVQRLALRLVDGDGVGESDGKLSADEAKSGGALSLVAVDVDTTEEASGACECAVEELAMNDLGLAVEDQETRAVAESYRRVDVAHAHDQRAHLELELVQRHARRRLLVEDLDCDGGVGDGLVLLVSHVGAQVDMLLARQLLVDVVVHLEDGLVEWRKDGALLLADVVWRELVLERPLDQVFFGRQDHAIVEIDAELRLDDWQTALAHLEQHLLELDLIGMSSHVDGERVSRDMDQQNHPSELRALVQPETAVEFRFYS